MDVCNLCPRRCGARRDEGELGACAQTSKMRISRIALHPYEEPPISGERGSGTVFFCGCALRCVFCQNRAISHGEVVGREYTPDELADAMLALERDGATNINLVTATHFTDGVVLALRSVKKSLKIPVVYNTSGYERVQTLRCLEGLVDIYMPDFKYASGDIAALYSGAADYPAVAEAALAEMYRQVGKYRFADNGTLEKGVLIRHLVLPGHRADSAQVLRKIADTVPVDGVILSLMSQYTPDFAMDCEYKNLHRRITSFEYDSVLKVAQELGFDGYMQAPSSAVKNYTPEF